MDAMDVSEWMMNEEEVSDTKLRCIMKNAFLFPTEN